MVKIFVSLLALFTLPNFAFSQNTKLDELWDELNNCKQNMAKLQEENDYLRKSLNVSRPVTAFEQDDIEVKLMKCTGNIKEQTITVVMVLTSHKPNGDFQFRSSQAIDLQGKSFEQYYIQLGGLSSRNRLYTDTPMEAVIKFTQILPSTKILKLINVFYHGVGLFSAGSFEFKNIDINWK